jgi:putative ABC transport system ATP-binding protein
MVNNPSLLLADEPTGNLDLKVRDEVIEILQNLQREFRVTLALVTHDQELGDLAQRKIVLRAGKID